MQIVLLEDHAQYRGTLIDLLIADIPSIKRSDFLEGGFLQQSMDLMGSFRPKIGEKTIFIVDSTLNETEKEIFPDSGNGYYLMALWLRDLSGKARTEGDSKTLENLRQNVSVIINPSGATRDLEYYPGYKALERECASSVANFLAFSKGEIRDPMLEAIGKIVAGEVPKRGKEF